MSMDKKLQAAGLSELRAMSRDLKAGRAVLDEKAKKGLAFLQSLLRDPTRLQYARELYRNARS